MSTDRKIHLERKVGICVGFAECTHIGRSHAAEQRDKRTTAGLSLSFEAAVAAFHIDHP